MPIKMTDARNSVLSLSSQDWDGFVAGDRIRATKCSVGSRILSMPRDRYPTA
jgi:hypothetical protein